MLVPALLLAAAVAAAPSAGVTASKVTVRIAGIADGTGTFTATGAIDDTGPVTATRTASKLRLTTTGKKGGLVYVVTGKTWRILSGTNAYRGLYGHGTMKRTQGGNAMTLTGTVERPRQPTA